MSNARSLRDHRHCREPEEMAVSLRYLGVGLNQVDIITTTTSVHNRRHVRVTFFYIHFFVIQLTLRGGNWAGTQTG
jgi:hypothetical protein